MPRASRSPVPGDDAFPERLEAEVPPSTHTLPGPRHPAGIPRAAPAPLRSDEGLAALLRVACPPPAWGQAGSQQGQQGCVCPARHGRSRVGAGLSRTAAAEPSPWEPPGRAGVCGAGQSLGWAGLKAAGTPRLSPRPAPPRRIPASIPGGRGAARSGSGGGRAR